MGILSTEPMLAISRSVAEVTVAGVWQGLVLFCAVALSLRLLPKVSAAPRFALWGMAFAMDVVMPLFSLHPAMEQAVVGGGSAAVQAGPLWGVAIAAMWATLTTFRAVCLLQQAIELRGVWRRAEPIADPGGWTEGSGRTVTLCTSAEVDSPCVIGFLSPRLLLPSEVAATLNEDELRQIVLHECEHLRRGDDWLNLLQKIGLVLFPLNPGLTWMDRRLGLERELACDARVVALTGEAMLYAKCLTRLAEHRRQCRDVALSFAAWTRRTELGQRVQTLLQPRPERPVRQTAAAAVLLSFGVLAGGTEMARVPRLISFATEAQTAAGEGRLTSAERGRTAVVPVVYHEPASHEASSTAMLVGAKLPARHSSEAGASQRERRHASVQAGARSSAAGLSPRLERTGVPEVSRARFLRTSAALPGAIPRSRWQTTPEFDAALSDDLPTYAAVRFGDGWLIFQL